MLTSKINPERRGEQKQQREHILPRPGLLAEAGKQLKNVRERVRFTVKKACSYKFRRDLAREEKTRTIPASP